MTKNEIETANECLNRLQDKSYRYSCADEAYDDLRRVHITFNKLADMAIAKGLIQIQKTNGQKVIMERSRDGE